MQHAARIYTIPFFPPNDFDLYNYVLYTYSFTYLLDRQVHSRRIEKQNRDPHSVSGRPHT